MTLAAEKVDEQKSNNNLYISSRIPESGGCLINLLKTNENSLRWFLVKGRRPSSSLRIRQTM